MRLQVLLFTAVIATCKADVPPTEEYPHQADLDSSGNVILYWKFDDTHVTFELHGMTTGWLGMGISPTGGMKGADIVLGWVEDGNVVATDRYGVGNEPPALDPEQNIELLDGMESDGWTVIKFRRQKASCEPDYDLPITADTLKVIYAFGDRDPDGYEVNFDNYHGENRGVKSLILLGSTGSQDKTFPEGEEETHITFDLLNDNFEIPADSTYYNCRLHKLPEFTEKQHVVKIEPVVQPGNEMFVHHILVYQCSDAVNDSLNVGVNTKCYAADMPPDFIHCTTAIQSWAIGGSSIYYPTHTGYPLGEDDSPKYVVVETHYDNPQKVSGTVDSSGLRFTTTSRLRQYDAGIITAGMIVSGVEHLIPPNAESFLSYGDCTESCLRQSMTSEKIEKLNVFGGLLHTHLLGTGLVVKHIRGNVELPYLFKDNSYNFNYQETRRLSEEREIFPGDSLQVVCDYKTKDAKENMTVGGLSTQQEMCVVFIHYYPKIPLALCQAIPERNQLWNYFGIKQATLNKPDYSIYNDVYDMVIIQPFNLLGISIGDYLDSLEWNYVANKRLEVAMRDMRRYQYCRGINRIPGVDVSVPAVKVDFPYVEEKPVCYISSSNETTTLEMPGGATSGNTSETTPMISLPWWSKEKISTARIPETSSIVKQTTSMTADALQTTTGLVGGEETTTGGTGRIASYFSLCLISSYFALFFTQKVCLA